MDWEQFNRDYYAVYRSAPLWGVTVARLSHYAPRQTEGEEWRRDHSRELYGVGREELERLLAVPGRHGP